MTNPNENSIFNLNYCIDWSKLSEVICIRHFSHVPLLIDHDCSITRGTTQEQFPSSANFTGRDWLTSSVFYGKVAEMNQQGTIITDTGSTSEMFSKDRSIPYLCRNADSRWGRFGRDSSPGTFLEGFKLFYRNWN